MGTGRIYRVCYQSIEDCRYHLPESLTKITRYYSPSVTIIMAIDHLRSGDLSFQVIFIGSGFLYPTLRVNFFPPSYLNNPIQVCREAFDAIVTLEDRLTTPSLMRQKIVNFNRLLTFFAQ